MKIQFLQRSDSRESSFELPEVLPKLIPTELKPSSKTTLKNLREKFAQIFSGNPETAELPIQNKIDKLEITEQSLQLEINQTNSVTDSDKLKLLYSEMDDLFNQLGLLRTQQTDIKRNSKPNN